MFDNNRRSRCIFCKKFCKLAISCRICNAMIIKHHVAYFGRIFAKSDVTIFQNAELPITVRSQTD